MGVGTTFWIPSTVNSHSFNSRVTKQGLWSAFRGGRLLAACAFASDSICSTVSSHDVGSRIFELRVSDPRAIAYVHFKVHIYIYIYMYIYIYIYIHIYIYIYTYVYMYVCTSFDSSSLPGPGAFFQPELL